MKKLLTLALVMIMLVTALTSCESLDNFFPTDDKPAETVRRTVTEEEWNANLELSNFEISNESNLPTSSYLNISGKITENAVSVVSNEIEFFAVCKDGIWYQLQKAEGKEEYSATNIDYPGIKLKDFMNLGAYADYSYDEQKGAYVMTEGESSAEVYFENGNIAKIELYIMYDGEKSYTKYYFKNVGTTVIDIPEFDITKRTVTEEEWNANLELSNFEISNESNLPTSYYLNISGKITENAVSVVSNEIEFFAVCKDGIWYQLQKAEGKEEYSATNIDYPGIKLKDFMNLGAYADYSYDEQKGAYVMTEGESSAEVYFENGNIAKIELYIMYDGEKSYTKYYFKNVGTTVIEVPEFTIVEE